MLCQSPWPPVHNLCLESDLFGAHACKFAVHGFHFGRCKNGLLIRAVSQCPRGLEDDVGARELRWDVKPLWPRDPTTVKNNDLKPFLQIAL